MTQLSRRFPPDPPKLVGRKWQGDADRLVQRTIEDLIDSLQGLPMKHSFTHKGGADDVAGTTDPTTVALANTADPGNAVHGFAPIDHVHPLDASGIDHSGDSYELNASDQELVYDDYNHKILEEILLQLKLLFYGNNPAT